MGKEIILLRPGIKPAPVARPSHLARSKPEVETI